MCITFAQGWIGLYLGGAKGPGLSKTLATTEEEPHGRGWNTSTNYYKRKQETKVRAMLQMHHSVIE